MDWTAIGAIGELTGAVAVVISIIYLAMQVRQNTRQIDHQTRTLPGGALTAAETLASNFRNSLARSPQVAAWLFDDLVRVPGTKLRFGLDALLGLIPGGQPGRRRRFIVRPYGCGSARSADFGYCTDGAQYPYRRCLWRNSAPR